MGNVIDGKVHDYYKRRDEGAITGGHRMDKKCLVRSGSYFRCE
jgi:hypothetical protein